MKMKKLSVPRILHELHGEETNIAEIILIYGIAVIAPLVVFFALRPVFSDLAVWKQIILFVILADLAGGVIANLTYGTTAYYEKKQWRKVLFIILHIAHPAGIWLLTGAQFPFLVYSAGFTILFSFITAFLFWQPRQQFAGFAFAVIGIALGFIIFSVPPYFRIASILYMLKLLYSFSVDHYGCRQ